VESKGQIDPDLRRLNWTEIIPQTPLKQQFFKGIKHPKTQRWRCPVRRVYCGDYAAL